MKMKKIIRVILVVVLTFILVGCSSKKGSTPKDFESTMSKMDFYVNTITNDVTAENMKVAKIADNKKFQIEYLEFSTVKDATSAFNSNKRILLKNRIGKYSETKKSENNYYLYCLETTDTYACVASSKNTMIYTSSNVEYKKDIEKIMKKLNY